MVIVLTDKLRASLTGEVSQTGDGTKSRRKGTKSLRKGRMTYWITGRTFPVKAQLKELGCSWDSVCKRWKCNKSVYEFLVNRSKGIPADEGDRETYPRIYSTWSKWGVDLWMLMKQLEFIMEAKENFNKGDDEKK